MFIPSREGWRLALALLAITALIGLVFYLTPPVLSGQ